MLCQLGALEFDLGHCLAQVVYCSYIGHNLSNQLGCAALEEKLLLF